MDSDRDYMAGLEKGLAVIECFGRDRSRLTIADAARLTGLSRATARRCLLTLTSLGYADFDGKFFQLTARALRLGYSYLASTSLPGMLQPVLEATTEKVNESCSASTLDDTEIVYLARSATKRIMSVGLSVGSRLPAFCTSMGRVLLAALPEAEAEERILRSRRDAFTRNTVTDPAALAGILAQVRDQGYCVVDQELELGLISIAVPVANAGGRVVAAINIGSQSARVSAREMAPRFLAVLQDASRRLRATLNTA